MLYFKIALRKLMRNKLYSAINIFGLAVGLTISILIFLWVKDEREYNRFHKNASDIALAMQNQKFDDGQTYSFSSLPMALAEGLNATPGLANFSRCATVYNMPLGNGDNLFNEKGYAVDASFLSIFSFQFIKGSSAAFNYPNAIIINESLANKYFGHGDAMGKTFKTNNGDLLKVTGIVKDYPANSTLSFDFIMPFNYYLKNNAWVAKNVWSNNIDYYVQLKDASYASTVTAALNNFIQRNKNSTPINSLFLHRLGKWRLYGEFKDGKNTGGRIEYVNLLMLIAVLVLLIASINFTNLSTAGAISRGKEVGIRKIAGAHKGALIVQFLSEALLTTLLAFLLSIALAFLLLPVFNQLTDKKLVLDVTDKTFLLWYGAIVLSTAIVAGSYPAFYMSSFGITGSLKGELKTGRRSLNFRRGLVVMQFALFLFFISSTIIVHKQVSFTQNKQLGYKQDNVIRFALGKELENNAGTFAQQLAANSNVESFTVASHQFIRGTSSFGMDGLQWPGKKNNVSGMLNFINVGNNFCKTMGLQIKQGRDFLNAPADSASVLINEKAAEAMGFKNPVGQYIETEPGKQLTIVGVVKNYQYGSPYDAVMPLMIVYNPQRTLYGFVRLTKQASGMQAIAGIEAVYKKFAPSTPFEYRYLEDDYNKLFGKENFMGDVTKYLSITIIFITCLGLAGLSTYATKQRSKEIGIRKVLGASAQSIVSLFFAEYARLIVISLLIAFPIVWYFASNWLQQFAYRTAIPLWVFAASFLTLIAIAFITTAYQTVKTALMNPVAALKTE